MMRLIIRDDVGVRHQAIRISPMPDSAALENVVACAGVIADKSHLVLLRVTNEFVTSVFPVALAWFTTLMKLDN
jgi:hypothetical protein